MSMFNWGSEDATDLPTATWFWVYWAVAVPLTLAVVFVWRVWWKWEERRYMHEMREKT